MHPAVIGQGMLWLTLAASAAAAILSAAGLVRRRPPWLRAGRALVVAAFGFATVASAVLVVALLTDDFRVAYVASRSARAVPVLYKLGAWWGGQEGSLLLWLWLQLGVAALVVTGRPDPEAPRLWPAATAALAAMATFFAALVAGVESPFRLLPRPPADGAGLNPLLQSPSMLLHPIALYLGYIGMTVPFAFALGALAVDETGDAWMRIARRWALGAWLFLGLGIVLGGEWAYKELGWGGYWAWDPVENASLVPWLLATALVHSGLAQERHGTLRRWNAVLALAVFITVLVGTFLTRSGVMASVHAFAESPTGPPFMVSIGLVTALSIWLLALRWDRLQDRQPIASLASREGAFVAGNIVLSSLAFAVLFGTVVPILSRLFGPGITLQAPYFERVSAPLWVLMLLLMAVGLVLPWRPQVHGARRTATWIRRLLPVGVGVLLFVALLAVGGLRRPTLLTGFAAAFVAGAVALAELVRWVRGRRGRGLAGRDGARSRLGGLLAHAGVAMVAVAVLASTAFQARTSLSLAVGQVGHLGGYTVRYEGLASRRVPGATEVYARVGLFRGDRPIASLEPARRLYDDNMAQFGTTTEVAVYRHVEGDVYVALAGWEEGGSRAAFELYVNPLVNWIWVGSILMLAGTALAVGSRAEARLVERRAEARLLEEVGRLRLPATPGGR